MALTGFMIPMKVIMMLNMWMPAPDMYIMKPFIITVLPGPRAISIALCSSGQRQHTRSDYSVSQGQPVNRARPKTKHFGGTPAQHTTVDLQT